MNAKRGVTPETARRIENLAELVEYDTNMQSVVKRAGFPSVWAAERACDRAGEHELANRVRFYGGRPGQETSVYSDKSQEFYLREHGDPLAGIVVTSHTLTRGRRGATGPRAARDEFPTW
jgi:hypothetical protein